MTKKQFDQIKIKIVGEGECLLVGQRFFYGYILIPTPEYPHNDYLGVLLLALSWLWVKHTSARCKGVGRVADKNTPKKLLCNPSEMTDLSSKPERM